MDANELVSVDQSMTRGERSMQGMCGGSACGLRPDSAMNPTSALWVHRLGTDLSLTQSEQVRPTGEVANELQPGTAIHGTRRDADWLQRRSEDIALNLADADAGQTPGRTLSADSPRPWDYSVGWPSPIMPAGASGGAEPSPIEFEGDGVGFRAATVRHAIVKAVLAHAGSATQSGLAIQLFGGLGGGAWGAAGAQFGVIKLPPPRRRGKFKFKLPRIKFLPFCYTAHYSYREVRYVRDLGLHWKMITMKRLLGVGWFGDGGVTTEVGQARGNPRTGPGAFSRVQKGRKFALKYQLVRRYEIEIWQVTGTILICPPTVLPLTRTETVIDKDIEDRPAGPARSTHFSARLYTTAVLSTAPLPVAQQIKNIRAAAKEAVWARERVYKYAEDPSGELWHGFAEGGRAE